MKVTEYIERAKTTLLSFEILPPLIGRSILDIFDVLDPLMEFNPPFINVTYHREEYGIKKLRKKKKFSRRPGTMAICAAIMNKYGVDPVPHILCGVFNKKRTENILIDLWLSGIRNIFVLRGDTMNFEKKNVPEHNVHNHSVDLVKQIYYLNKGIYLDKNFIGVHTTDFCIGVTGYPEKHFESPNMNEDIFHIRKKITSGADYIITQMFFDNTKYFNFVSRCRSEGLTVPIIPGIKPISSKSQLWNIPAHFYINLPHELVCEVQRAKNNKDVSRIGIEWAIQQSKELKKYGIPVIHYYTMSNPHNVYEIVKNIC
ncbi:methylenetetrahydrofolate reductase [Candidatus Walczuchella monophlebidarum]|uniref:Methylenetetrahydrofolate reductase n=1 Tax=Candidatus Walczuchella monophlebidarum TaxID=1415657 RepID=A0A068DQK3_9FLAO|nr:methylenetetrahydrofolate reductase [Candidatus Walczuchella monophlebidarum]AID37532.1 5,10-methylenetetrahydrofolate reductase [Candidatus Walczuchella monophlebidarum]